MGTQSDNLRRLKASYQAWHDSKGGSTNAWLDLFSDSVRILTTGETASGLAFARDGRSKQDAVAYLTGLLKDWKMVHWTPETFVDGGDRIAMFGRCAWTFKATGKTAEVRIAHFWRFDDGKVVELNEIFDTARAAAAALPDAR